MRSTGHLRRLSESLNTWPLGRALELRALRQGELHRLTLTPREARG